MEIPTPVCGLVRNDSVVRYPVFPRQIPIGLFIALSHKFFYIITGKLEKDNKRIPYETTPVKRCKPPREDSRGGEMLYFFQERRPEVCHIHSLSGETGLLQSAGH